MHGAEPGAVHGSAYVIDLARQTVHQPLKQVDEDIEWFGDEGGRGLRGIAFDGDTVYVAASNRLLAFDSKFRPAGSWQNPYLDNCRGMGIWQRKLFLACSGNDCVLSFDLDENEFDWAMQLQSENFQFRPIAFDPGESEGPLFINKLQLTSVHGTSGGLHIAGMKTGGVLHYNGKTVYMSVEVPAGAQDILFFRNGVVFNDSNAGVVRYVGDNDGSEDRALHVPFFTASDHQRSDPDESRRIRRGYARGLCVMTDRVVAGGSTPAGVSLYDLRDSRKLASIWFTKDVREAVNTVAVWPY